MASRRHCIHRALAVAVHGCSLLLLGCCLLGPGIRGVAGAQQDDDAPRQQPERPGSTSDRDAIRVDPEAAEQMGVRVATVTRQPLVVAVPAPGRIDVPPDQSVAVTAPITGRVVRFLVEPGDAVQRGQVVALMSSPELAALRVEAMQKREEARAGLQQAEADLQLARLNERRQRLQAAADLNQAQTQVDLARERHARNQELQAAGAIARRQVQESQAELAAAQAALTRAQSRLGVLEAAGQWSRAEAGVAVERSRLRLSDATYRTRLRQLNSAPSADGLLTVTAPIAGEVADRTITPGETVSVEAGSKPLMTIINTQRLWASADVYEKDLSRISVGQSALITVTGFPRLSFRGRVVQIGTAVQGSTRVIPVKVELEDPRGLLKPGMFAAVRILVGETATPVLTIPLTAVVDGNGSAHVMVKDGDGYRPVAVTLGTRTDRLVEVKQGLQEGQQVVSEGATLLYSQSLGGAGIASDDDDQPQPGDGGRQPWSPWLLLPVAGTIGGIGYGLGRRSQARPAARSPITPIPSSTEQEVESYLNQALHQPEGDQQAGAEHLVAEQAAAAPAAVEPQDGALPRHDSADAE